MEALQRMMTRRLDEHSYKRTAKRLVVDEYTNDADFNDKTEIASMNPAYDIIYGETVRARSSPNNSATDVSFSTTTCAAITSPSSVYHIEPTSTVTATVINDDHSHTDKLLRKVSLAVRRKLTGSKPFVSEQRNTRRVSHRNSKDSNHDDSKNSQKIAQNDSKKQVRLKSAKKMIDLVDLCSIGCKHRSEHRKLLSDEYGDD